MGRVTSSLAEPVPAWTTIQKGQIKPEYSLVLLVERYWQQDPAHVVCGRLGLSVTTVCRKVVEGPFEPWRGIRKGR